MERGLLLVVSGPSGVGKGTVIKKLVQDCDNIYVSVSCTTRNPRPGEQDGVNYFFKSKEEFATMLKNNEFLEYAKVFENYYGTPAQNVEEKLSQGKDVILEIDVQGALKVKESVGDRAVYVFVAPPSMLELKNRLTGRGTETEDQISKRFAMAFLEIGYLREYDYIVKNDVVEHAADTIKKIIEVEKCRVDFSPLTKKLIKESEEIL